jgi:hypothetical protein
MGVVQPVVFVAPVVTTMISTATIVADTSSVPATLSYDPSPIDAILSQMFGIVADVTDAVQTFTTVVANSVKASLVAVVDLFAKNATILPGGSLTVPSGANQIAGESWLDAGASDVFVSNSAITSSSNVIVTPNTPVGVPLAVTDKEDGVGFHVGIQSPQAVPISFDWLIVQTYDAGPASPAQLQAASQAPATMSTAAGGSSQDAPDETGDVSTATSTTTSTDDTADLDVTQVITTSSDTGGVDGQTVIDTSDTSTADAAAPADDQGSVSTSTASAATGTPDQATSGE